MVDIKYISSVVEELMKEYDTLLRQHEDLKKKEETAKCRREEVERKIEGLKQSLQGLSLYTTAQHKPTELTVNMAEQIREVLGDISVGVLAAGKRPKTLTECCREILGRNDEWKSALQVRQFLHAAGFDFSQYKSNPLSSIHTTLKRLVANGEAESQVVDDTATYRMKDEKE